MNPNDLLESDGGPLIADNSEINVLFIHSAVDDMDLTPYAFRVLCHLKRRANHSGKAFPGMRSIAKKCGMSLGMVHRSIVDLQKRGMLAVQHRGENESNLYVLTSPKCWKNLDGSPFTHPSLGCSYSEQGCSPNEQGCSSGEQGVHGVNSAVHPVNERRSKEGDPLKAIQKKEIQKETTTTPHAQEKATRPAGEAVVVVSSWEASEETPQITAETLDALGTKFRLNRPQKEEVRSFAQSHGLGYVEEKIALVESEPRRNKAVCLLKALREDWQLPAVSKEIEQQRDRERRREERRRQEEAQIRAEEEARRAEHEAFERALPSLAAQWHQAGPEQRRALAEGIVFKCSIPKGGQEPSRMFLSLVWAKLDPEGHAAHRKAFPPPTEAAA